MENITTGHWIFASLFLIVFVGFLIWSYRKEASLHKLQFGSASVVLVGIVVVLFVFYVLKQIFS